MGGNYRNQNQRNNFRGGRGGRGGFKRNFNSRNDGERGERDQSKNQWQTNERLSEPDAGITQFISTAKGFQGIIKSR